MYRNIKKVAVIGAGVMGAGIAAQVANGGIPVVLLDIVPKDGKDRNAIAAGAVEEWTDAGGQRVQARFGGMQGATAVVLLTSDGKRLVVPLVQLSPASQQRARQLAAVGR